MSCASQHHRELDADGIGKCSVPMWCYPGVPAGFCDEPAYGERPPGETWMNYAANERMRTDGRYNGYVPALACVNHGGPRSRTFKDGNAWCAVFPDFVDLQESAAGFGDTPEAARAELKKATGRETT
jgi:hypothetical protein